MTAVGPKTTGSHWELIDDQHLNSFADIRSPVGTNTAHTRTTNQRPEAPTAAATGQMIENFGENLPSI